MRGIVTALQFLTRITVDRKMGMGNAAIAKSVKYFPIIGLIIGVFLVAVNYLFSLAFPIQVVAAVVLVSWIWISGAFHLDGFMDSVDGLLGGGTREKALAIMRDSNTGAFGVIAAICLILLKFVLLGALAAGGRTGALIVAPVLGKWAMVCIMPFAPYAREKGKASFTGLVGKKDAVIATIIAFACVFILLEALNAAMVVGAALVFMLLTAFFVMGKIGGMTGDSYGALNEITETIVLMVFVLIGGF